jgi:plastocyanin
MRIGMLVTVMALVLACDGNHHAGPEPLVEIRLAANSGDGQTGTVGQALPERLRVLVTEDGRPAPGTVITWSAPSGGTVTASGPTGQDGIAEADWMLGGTAGVQAAKASVPDAAGSPLTFIATAEAGPAARLVRLGGFEPEGGIGYVLVAGALATQVRDAFGNPIPGVPVEWSVDSGDATVQPESAVSDDQGIVRATVKLGSATGGRSRIRASSDGLEGSPVEFVATARLYVFVEDNDFGPAEVTVKAGTAVTWYWADAFGAHNIVPDVLEPTRSGDPVVVATKYYSYTFETPGDYRYYCQMHGMPGGHGMSGVVHVTP